MYSKRSMSKETHVICYSGGDLRVDLEERAVLGDFRVGQRLR